VKSYNISEARENFASILKDVEAGEAILLTRTDDCRVVAALLRRSECAVRYPE
jgi:antitoxin (DNA-binding transcriptional repressor) of toxin-antitoxin stability system